MASQKSTPKPKTTKKTTGKRAAKSGMGDADATTTIGKPGDGPDAPPTGTAVEPVPSEDASATAADNAPVTAPDAASTPEAVTEASAPAADDTGDHGHDRGDGDALKPVVRVYKGDTYTLHPQADGTFKLGDLVFKSLTAAAQHVLGVSGGVSGPRWWLGSSASKTGSRLPVGARKAKAAAERARKLEAKAKVARDVEIAAWDEVIALLVAAKAAGRLTEKQRERLL